LQWKIKKDEAKSNTQSWELYKHEAKLRNINVFKKHFKTGFLLI